MPSAVASRITPKAFLTATIHGPDLGNSVPAETPMAKRSHLYHPGFRHEFRSADPDAARDLAEKGAEA